jgi:ubiquinone/menaquinone biosynthesis C-methylase UbiE
MGMLNNWISGEEIVHLLRRFRREPILREKLAARLRLTTRARVRASWAHTEAPPTGWWDIPAVQRRWNRMVSGDPAIAYQDYVARKYGRRGWGAKGLSLGCGSGAKEILWARTGLFSSLHAYDLSEQRIRAATATVRGTPEGDVIRYRAADVTHLSLPEHSYDIVLFDHSLHHMSPLEPLLLRIRKALTPEGLLVANEFIGPTRFQWTDRQLSGVNELLEAFPAEYTTLFGSTFPRLKAIRPSKLAMWLSDPSEAVESSNIMPLLEKHFNIREFRGYGGTLLHLLFSGIAHHFINPDDRGRHLMESSFTAEDRLLDAHQLDHDFALIICGNRDADASKESLRMSHHVREVK